MRPEKQAIVAEIKQQVSEATYIIFVDFSRINTEQTIALRRKLSEQKGRFQVVPNRLFKVVAGELGMEGLDAALKGPTALVFGAEDAAATAKIVQDFIKEQKVLTVKMGWMDGEALTAAQVEHLATLPSKKTLQGMFVATLAAPMSNLVGVFSQKLASLVYVLKAAADKKSEGAA